MTIFPCVQFVLLVNIQKVNPIWLNTSTSYILLEINRVCQAAYKKDYMKHDLI